MAAHDCLPSKNLHSTRLVAVGCRYKQLLSQAREVHAREHHIPLPFFRIDLTIDLQRLHCDDAGDGG